MEDLAPVHNCIVSLIASLESRHSLRQSIKRFLARDGSHINDEFTKELSVWFVRFEQSNQSVIGGYFSKTPYRIGLIRLLVKGLQGQSVHEFLILLEKEIHQASIGQIESELKTQPLKLLIPLLLLQFPAFLLLLFGPILRQFIESFSF